MALFIRLNCLVGLSLLELLLQWPLLIEALLDWLAITCPFAVIILDGGWMFLLIARLQDISSQESFFPIFLRVGGRIGSTYYTYVS